MVSRGRHARVAEVSEPKPLINLVMTKQSLKSFPMSDYKVKTVISTRVRSVSADFGKHPDNERRRASALVDQLLLEIYSNGNGCMDYNSATSNKSQKNHWYDISELRDKDLQGLRSAIGGLESHVVRVGSILVRQLKRRDALRRQRDARCDVISYILRKRVPDFSPEMRFSIEPLPGESGFSQWHSAMKMVSQLPEGIPPEFRRRLWLSLADRHLSAKGIDWPKVERNCFSEWSHPADAELGVQIVKDLHRTGCSLFCGKDGQENQALLKRVLLAYARWNKAVGYCQGFNMLAALILQVTEKCEADALKLMIYLIEGVLPDSYFADSLRGLSVDMAVFRELLRTKLPRLSRHLDTLQVASKEGTTSYEPPLTNVFTMQWFLTLFCNCLPQPTVLRVWDLILLEGNEILLRTSLAIWHVLADKILTVKSADEFYCLMGVLMREILEYDLIDANTLIKGIVTIGPLTELRNLREHYLYNINPWGSSIPAATTDRRMKVYHKDRLVLDIGVLKKQYTKLKQRQRQAHIIFNTAVAARQTTRPAPVAMNHLLLGKSALVPAKRLGPPKGAIPPARQAQPQPPKTLHWKDTRRDSSSSSSDTELCDDPDNPSSDEDEAKCQLPDDNLKNSDKTLMIEDNTSCTVTNISASVIDVPTSLLDLDLKEDFEAIVAPNVGQNLEDNQFETKSDIFDTENSDLYDLNKLNAERSDSIPSEDGFDFENFLEERVNSFKEKTFSSEESLESNSEQERLKYARKNSERALEIIQENSLILHRILQCQSRLTPTPPPMDDDDDDSEHIDKNKFISDLLALSPTYIPEEAESTPTPTNDLTILNNLYEGGDVKHEEANVSTDKQGSPHNEREIFPCHYSTFIVDTELGNYSSLASVEINDSEIECIDTKNNKNTNDYECGSKDVTSIDLQNSKDTDISENNINEAFDVNKTKDNTEENIVIKTDYKFIDYLVDLSTGSSQLESKKYELIDTSLPQNINSKTDYIDAITNKITQSGDSKVCEPVIKSSSYILSNTDITKSSSIDDIINKYSTISKEGSSHKILDQDEPEVSCNIEKYSLTKKENNSASSPTEDFFTKESDYDSKKYGAVSTSNDDESFTKQDDYITGKYSAASTPNEESLIKKDNYNPEKHSPGLTLNNENGIKESDYNTESFIKRSNLAAEKYSSTSFSNEEHLIQESKYNIDKFCHVGSSKGDTLVKENDYDPNKYIEISTSKKEEINCNLEKYNQASTSEETSAKRSDCTIEKYSPVSSPKHDNLKKESNYNIEEFSHSSDFFVKRSDYSEKCSPVSVQAEESFTINYDLEKYSPGSATEDLINTSYNHFSVSKDDFIIKESDSNPGSPVSVSKEEKHYSTDNYSSMPAVKEENLIEISDWTEEGNIKEADYNLEKYRLKLGSPLSEEPPKEELIEIDKNSKYNSILEYSRNLDEKFNSLILKSSGIKTNEIFNPKFTSSLDIPREEKLSDPKPSLSCSSFLEGLNLDKPRSSLSETETIKFSYKLSPGKLTPEIKSPIIEEAVDDNKPMKSPKSDGAVSPNLKSPNRIFNPFPVNISTRQNKDVAVRLGLYKK